MFSRRSSTLVWRSVVVWAVVTVAAAVTATSAPVAWRAVAASTGSDAVAGVVVATSTTGLALALAWLWVITSATVAGLVAGRAPMGGGATRRLVLAACGAAVLAGASVPALAAAGDGPELLVGLALPERAVAPPRVHRPPTTARRPAQPRPGIYVVRPGDSLWSIARAHPRPTTSIDQRWRAIWRANRAVVGDDPGLILPGQALHLPTHPTTPDTHSDGDR